MAVDLTDPQLLRTLIEKERGTQRSRMRWRAAIIAIVTAAYLLPFYYLFVTVFKTTPEYAQKGVLELPDSQLPFVDNVLSAWTIADLGTASLNSLTYALFGAGLAVAIAATAAFGLTRLRLLAANGWFMLIFAGTLFPFQMYLVPLLFAYQQADAMNTWAGMLLLYVAICIPFPLLVLRSSFAAISREIDEAARIEGAGEWRVFISMIVPNSKGPLIALFLLQFTFIWNDLLFSSVLASGIEVRSIMVALQSLQGLYAAKPAGPTVLMTATLVSSIPTVVLFVLLRKYFMSGLQISTK